MKPFSAALLCLFAACANPSGAYDPDERGIGAGVWPANAGEDFGGRNFGALVTAAT